MSKTRRDIGAGSVAKHANWDDGREQKKEAERPWIAVSDGMQARNAGVDG